MARIYVSSTYEDLKEYRNAVYDALHKAGHTVLAMEDYIARDQRPLDKCLKDVAGCDYYVGIFAWRYGYIPGNNDKSITELEFRKAGEVGKTRLIFLLDRTAAWTPLSMDSVTGENDQGQRIAALRDELGKEFLASFFETPDQLATLVSVVVSVEEARERLKSFSLPEELTDLAQIRRFGSTMMQEIQEKLLDAIREAETARLVEIELGIGATWWSTRLYLLAALAADYTGIQRLVFTEREGRFIGMTSPATTRDAVAAVYPEVDRAYRESIPQLQHPVLPADQKLIITLNNFRQQLSMLKPGGEAEVKVYVRRDLLIGWLGNSLDTESVTVESTHELDLPWLTSLILERPAAFVPLVQNGQLMRVVDRIGLAMRIAQTVVKQQRKRRLG